MRLLGILLLGVVLVLPVLGCGGGGGPDLLGECDLCTSTEQCDTSWLTCRHFSDGTWRCSWPTQITCP